MVYKGTQYFLYLTLFFVWAGQIGCSLYNMNCPLQLCTWVNKYASFGGFTDNACKILQDDKVSSKPCIVKKNCGQYCK